MSTGTPSGDRPVLPADIAADPLASSRDPLIKLLLESVPFLRNLGFQVTELAPYFLAAYAKGPIRAQSWVKMDRGSNTGAQKQAFRSRLMAAIQIELENMHCVVVEIERRPGEGFGLAAFFLDYSVDLEAFMDLVGYAVVRNSRWPPFDSDQHLYDLGEDQNVEGRKGHHRGEIRNGEQMANKIKDCFLD